MRHIRSQSAMEYLMTYGWSILIIAVVLGALFSLGVFSSANLSPRAQPGNCKIIRMAGEANPEGICQGELPEFVAQFNGQSSYVNTGSGSTIRSFPNSAITISAWIYPKTSGAQQDIVDAGYQTSYTGYEFGLMSPSQLMFRYDTNSIAYRYVESGVNLPVMNNWYQVAATYNGAYVSFYVNGTASGTPVAASGNFYTSSSNPLIGIYTSLSGFPFNGLISNFQIYNTTLDANQINALYMEGIGGAPVDPYHIVGWWPLNGDENDYSGNGNTGTPTNVIFNSQWTPGYTQP